MPSARPRRRRALQGILSPAEAALVFDRDPPADGGFEWMALQMGLERGDQKSRAALAWRSAQPNALREWIRLHPGTRPRCWWAFDAPERLRQIVKGRGVPSAMSPDYGAPPSWWDWSNDLAIESQAAYLRRHGLLTAGEQRRIAAAAYEQEVARIACSAHRWKP